MFKRVSTASVVAIALLALTGCTTGSTTGGGSAEPTPTATTPAAPVLSVPETAFAGSVSVMVNGGPLDGGTTATVYAFPVGWEEQETPSCTGTPQRAEISINGTGKDQEVQLSIPDGYSYWMLSAGDFTTECGAPGALTMAASELKLRVSAPGGQANVPMNIAVSTARGDSESPPVPVSMTVYGPWDNLPEAERGTCDSPSAASVEGQLDLAAVGYIDTQLEWTPTEPGVYAVSVATEDGPRWLAEDTCEEWTTFTVTP